MPMPETPFRKWTLELREPQSLVASDAGAIIRWLPEISVAEYLRLYVGVGEPWKWVDRRLMPPTELATLLSESNRHVATLTTSDGTEVGFTELCRHSSDDCEIAYFGLLPQFNGKGLGRKFFRQVVHKAQSLTDANSRVWLTTCEWDSPAALPFYQRSGFQVVSEEWHVQCAPLDESL